MTELTPAARERLDDYLQRLRSELREARAEGADEVEQSVREHIEIALEDSQTPVSATDMIAILDRLGPPEQWAGDEASHAVDNPRSTMDDSRLPYVSFGLVIASIVFFMFFSFFLLIPAMFVSRTWIEQKRERGEPLGARRWLVYPAIALVLAFVALVVLIGPSLGTLAFLIGNDARQLFDIPANRAGELRFLAGLQSLVFGSWWIVTGGLCALLVRPVRFVFAPLLDGLRRKHFALLAAIGALLGAAGAALIYYRH
jgi:hypothetical protein